MKISQSLIKSWISYQEEKLCGLQVEARYFKGLKLPKTDVQRKGNYLEYLCTGEPDRDGNIPEPDILKSGTNKGEPTEEYQKVISQAENFKKAMAKYEVEILEKNFILQYGEYEGIADIIATTNFGPNGLRLPEPANIIIDIKGTGLLYDKWQEYGWYEESLQYKAAMLLQSVHYPWLALKQWGEQMRFQYWVFSMSNRVDYEIFEILLEPDRMQKHEAWLQAFRDQLDLENRMGWTARPSVSRCASCPLKDSCQHFMDVPRVKTIYLPNN